MKNYHNFIGIDIGKFNFMVAIFGQPTTQEFENTSDGIAIFLETYKDLLPDALCVLETTGGYESELLYTLCGKKISVHRADTRKVKNFIRSFGTKAKTDNLDAKALAHYGQERHKSLEEFKPQSQKALDLFQLVQRRSDLKKTCVAEKNRLQGPQAKVIKQSCQDLIAFLQKEIETLQNQIQKLIEEDPILKEKRDVLKTIPGIGDVVAFELLVLLPELGTLNRREIASLAGLAPRANESGKFQGYRRTGHSRLGVKPILFLAAMAARNAKATLLSAFYESLIERGKKKMVALTAVMRRLLVIANAKIRDLLKEIQTVAS